MNGEQRLTAIEQRMDRFETRMERELAAGSANFARREVVDRIEKDLHSDIGDLQVTAANLSAEINSIRKEQREGFKAIRNIVVTAILSAGASVVASLIVWAATT